MRTIVRSPLLIVAIFALGACATPTGGRGGTPPGGAAGGACKTIVEQSREQFALTSRLLALTPTQQVLWDNYEARVGELINDSLRLDAFKGSRRYALQQIDDKIDAVRQRIVLMEKTKSEAALLYQSLDEGQKRVADRQLVATLPDLNSGSVCLSGSGGFGGGPGGNAGGAPGR